MSETKEFESISQAFKWTEEMMKHFTVRQSQYSKTPLFVVSEIGGDFKLGSVYELHSKWNATRNI
jgi:hypothetical protein